MKRQNSLFIFIILILSASSGFAQPLTLPFEQHLRMEQERALLNSSQNWHAVYPLRVEVDGDTLEYGDVKPIGRSGMGPSSTLHSWLVRKLFNERLIRVDTMGIRLQIDPLVHFELGRQGDANRTTWVNTRGFRVDGALGRRFAFHSAFYENQAVFPDWLDSQIRSRRIVPGQGMYKDFKGTGFDYAFAEGHISYSPSKYFNLRFGHGKNFIGDGYRSLLLSDVAFNYPYLALNTRVWNIEYVNIFSQLMDIQAPKGPRDAWQKKYTTTHYLSWHIMPWLTAGLFETIVWQASDSSGQRGFDLNYLNPVIFYRPVEFSLGSPDNALLGGSLRVKFLKRNFVYAQLMLDEFKLEHVLKGDGWWANKHGFQLGVKGYDPFGLKNLYLQAEYNHVRPYTYSHNNPVQNYAHYNQPLAHPQGANFRELVLLADYRHNRWQLDYKLVYTTYGADTANLNFGHDLYRSYYTYVTEFDNQIGQGLKTTLVQHDLSVAWLMNPATNLSLTAGLTLHHCFSDQSDQDNMVIRFGLRSSLFNTYYDY